MKVNDPRRVGSTVCCAEVGWRYCGLGLLDCFGLLSCVACYLRGTRSSNAATAANLTGDSRKKNAVKDR